jgi:hypothetical protein
LKAFWKIWKRSTTEVVKAVWIILLGQHMRDIFQRVLDQAYTEAVAYHLGTVELFERKEVDIITSLILIHWKGSWFITKKWKLSRKEGWDLLILNSCLIIIASGYLHPRCYSQAILLKSSNKI